MASTPQLLAAVLAFGVIGVGGGYAAGVFTEPSIPGASGQPAPLAGNAGQDEPTPKPTTRTVTPVPDDTPPLDTDIVFRRKAFEVRGVFRSEISLHVPGDWRETEPRDDREQFTDPVSKRWIRIESGFTPLRPPGDSRAAKMKQLQLTEPPNPNLKLDDSRPDEVRQGKDGEPRNISTLVYSYAPEASSAENTYVTRLVLTRWVGFGADGDAAVELSVTGLPQDAKALEKILDRATDTVTRRDL
jgi:hypothetical protein